MILAGRSAVWLARSVRDAEVGGSNPLAPIFPSFASWTILCPLYWFIILGEMEIVTNLAVLRL